MTMDTKKLKDPGFPLPKDGKQTSDLMSRLQVFLPQLQAANQDLPAEPGVDIDLQEQESDEEDDHDSTSSDNVKQQPKESKDEESPMIQIQFALTDPNDPMMELLADKNDDEKDEDDSSTRSHDGTSEIDESKENAVRNLLLEGTPEKDDTNINNHEKRKSEKKKPLITELSE